MGSIVRISTALLAAIRADVAVDPAVERCGLLLGEADEIADFIPTRNAASEPAIAFEIDPAALVAAHRAARAGGPAVIGHYHSHPSGRAFPSPRDATAAHGDGAFWLIFGSRNHALFAAVTGGSIAGAFERRSLIGTGAPFVATELS